MTAKEFTTVRGPNNWMAKRMVNHAKSGIRALFAPGTVEGILWSFARHEGCLSTAARIFARDLAEFDFRIAIAFGWA